MAVSKTQSERPAIGALIDLANALEIASNTHAGNIATLTEGLGDEISARTAADTALQVQLGDGFSQTSVTQSLSATNQQVLLLGQEQDATSLAVTTLFEFMNRFHMGSVAATEIAAEGTSASSVVFSTPFNDGAQVCIHLCCTGDDEILTNLECVLVSSTNTGFSYAIKNNDAESAHTVGLAYVAVKVN